MGSAAALRLSPGGAVAVGLFAGVLSTVGFGWLAGVLEQKINLGDTCGVHVSCKLNGIIVREGPGCQRPAGLHCSQNGIGSGPVAISRQVTALIDLLTTVATHHGLICGMRVI